MASAVHALPTVGEIARRLNKPLHRIEYVLKTRNIQPCGIAGNCRVYPEEAVDQIAAELESIDKAKDYLR